MKILIGGFVAESNAYVAKPCEIQDFTMITGDAIGTALNISELAKQNNMTLVPTIFASGAGTGRVSLDAFQYILNQFIKGVKQHRHEIDGIFLFLHGASNVIDLEDGAGELCILREIRKIVGPYLPIAMVNDPHGNLSQDYATHCNIIRTLRHSPHTDKKETHALVFNALVDLLQRRRIIHPEYRKVPILLGGERCVSLDEPLLSINKLLNEIEADPRIMCCSYHIGYLRHDDPKCGASVIVVPYNSEDQAFAAQKADEIAAFAFSKRKEFRFTGYAADPEEALQAMLDFDSSPCFLTDSGDNVTAGAPGSNTTVLNKVLNLPSINKEILFASITDKKLCDQVLIHKKIGDQFDFELGAEIDFLSTKVQLSGTLIAKGNLHRHFLDEAVLGTCYNIKLQDLPITIIIADYAVSFAILSQYERANVDIHQYDLIIVKQGYLYPELKAMAKHYVMSLTDGATLQRTEKLTYKTVMRPMYPLDDM